MICGLPFMLLNGLTGTKDEMTQLESNEIEEVQIETSKWLYLR